jgi:hypothetical protein
MSGPLAGLKVLDIATIIAASLATTLGTVATSNAVLRFTNDPALLRHAAGDIGVGR